MGISISTQGDKGHLMNSCASKLEITVEKNEKFLPRETWQGAPLGVGGQGEERAFELGWSPGADKSRDNKHSWKNRLTWHVMISERM